MNIGLLVAVVLSQPAGESSKRIDLFHPPVAERNAPIYRLERENDGLVYHGPKFDAHVAADGTVHFDDKIKAKPFLPTPVPLPPGTPTLGGLLVDFFAHRPLKAAPSPATSEPPPQYVDYAPPNWASSREHIREQCENAKDIRCQFPKDSLPATGGTFVDWERFLVGLPEKEADREEKARFLAATSPMRDHMAEQARTDNLKAALWDLPSLLDRMWSNTRSPAAERRRLLFELWHEYAEMSGTEASCATILGFIRRHLPAGSPDAYTADELASYRTDAGPRFQPYSP